MLADNLPNPYSHLNYLQSDRQNSYATVNHYIVIYGYNSSENEFVCHYGWPGKSCIYVNRDLRTNIWGDYVIAELEY